MAVPSIATTPRHRRRNHHHHPQWSTPLPLSAAVPKKKRRSAAPNAGAVVLCASFLCIVVFFGAMFSTTLPSFLPEHRGRAGKLLSGRRHKLMSVSLSGSGAGSGRRTPSQPRPIAYVDLSALPSSHQYDVVIVGCGPAGLSAALFASRMGLSVLVCGSPSAGALAGTDTLDNYPSFLGIGGDGGGGQGWVDAAVGQAASFGADFAPPSLLATGLAKVTVQQYDIFEVHLGDKKVRGKSVIVASGSTPRRLDLPHEGDLWGRSLHSCALCDGDIYAGKDGSKKSVVVVGGGDAAVEAIFLLHKLGAGTIHWIHRREEYSASAVEVGRVKQLANVEVWTPFVVAEWMVKKSSSGKGEDDAAYFQLEGVRIVGAKDGAADPDAASSLTIPCDGAFLMIGSTPNSDWLRGSGMDIDPSTKLIRTALSLGADKPDTDRKDSNSSPQLSTATSIDGVFAVGEVVDELYRQALTASAEGAKAAIDAQRYLRHMGLETGRISQPSDAKKEAVTRKEPQISHSDELKGEDTGPVDCDLTKVECIQRLVASHPVVVFSKHYCPYCRRALEALRSFAEPIVLDLTQIRNGFEVQDALASMTGRRTVPNVFVGGKSIGGGDETTTLFREGKLEGMLRDAGAI